MNRYFHSVFPNSALYRKSVLLIFSVLSKFDENRQMIRPLQPMRRPIINGSSRVGPFHFSLWIFFCTCCENFQETSMIKKLLVLWPDPSSLQKKQCGTAKFWQAKIRIKREVNH